MPERSNGEAKPRSKPLAIQVVGLCDGVTTHSVKQEVLRTSVKRICRIGTNGIESGFEERLHIGIKSVQGLKTKCDKISNELEGSNLDIAVLRETKEKVTESELQSKFTSIHIWSGVGKDRGANRGILYCKIEQMVEKYNNGGKNK
jgi:hypothetical protein